MKFHDFVLMIAIVLAGCASPQSESPSMSHGKTGKTQSICDLATRGITDGLIARVEATYKTDKSHYAYLLSKGCGVDGVLDVVDMEPILVETLQNFYEFGDRRCAQAGTPYVCVLEAKVNVDIKIVRGQTRKFAAEILEVHSFFFVDEKSRARFPP